MSPSADRTSRFPLDVPVTFTADGDTAKGRTRNVSRSGLLALFSGYVEIWANGELSLLVNDYYLTLRARVARISGSEVGLTFVVKDENDSRAIEIMIEYAAANISPAEAAPSDS